MTKNEDTCPFRGRSPRCHRLRGPLRYCLSASVRTTVERIWEQEEPLGGDLRVIGLETVELPTSLPVVLGKEEQNLREEKELVLSDSRLLPPPEWGPHSYNSKGRDPDGGLGNFQFTQIRRRSPPTTQTVLPLFSLITDHRNDGGGVPSSEGTDGSSVRTLRSEVGKSSEALLMKTWFSSDAKTLPRTSLRPRDERTLLLSNEVRSRLGHPNVRLPLSSKTW